MKRIRGLTPPIIAVDDQLAEVEANHLLEINNALGKRKGCYTDKQITRRTAKEWTNADDLVMLVSRAQIEADELLGDDVEAIMRLAKLTDNQRTLWKLRMFGMTQAEMAEALDISQQCVSARLKTCKRKMATALIAYPHYGWFEVYLSEVRRK